MAALEFAILGPLEVRRDGEPVAVTSPQRRALLSLLLLRANEPVPQDELIEELWDGQPPSTARASLQNQIHALRKTLGADVLEREPSGYVIRVENDGLDTDRFRRIAAEARRGGDGERAAKLRDALACWRGPALLDVRAEAFAQTDIARLEEERLTVLEERIDADLALGRHIELVPELDELVAAHPLRERFWAQLMLALYRCGRQADALGTYRRAHHRFTADLGIEPGVVLRELQRNILVQDPGLDDPGQQLGSTLERAAAILPRGQREQAESLFEYGRALMLINERRQALATLEAAVRAAVAAREPGLEQRAKLTLSFLAIFLEGKAEEHLSATREAIDVFERLGDDAGLALAYWHRANLLWAGGQSDEAAAWARRGIERALRAGDRYREAACRGKLAQSVAAGTTPVERAIAECEDQLQADCWDAEPPFVVLGALAGLHAHADRIDEARAFVNRALDEVRTAGLAWSVISGLFVAGMVERSVWNLAEAETHIGTAYQLLEAEDDRSFLADCAGWLACTRTLGGDVEGARRPAQIARRLAKPVDPSADMIWRRALALIAAHDGHHDQAAELSSQALELARRTDVLLAHGDVLEEMAIIRELAGEPGSANDALIEALDAFERKGSVAGAKRVRERLAGAGPAR